MLSVQKAAGTTTTIHWGDAEIRLFNEYLKKSGCRITKAYCKGGMNGGYDFDIACTNADEGVNPKQLMIDFMNWYNANAKFR